ncbi:MAG: flippase-like domain-containing protein [Acidobacteriota bacterium]|nr:flippase-like domain-containing protein [Acidobacteriota bacterium]
MIGALISLALLAWVVRSANLSEVWGALRSASYIYLLPIAALVVLSFVLRALRWQALFRGDGRPRWGSLFVAMMIGYLANNVLPARAGEVVRAYVIGRREGIARSTALATVVVERVADLVTALLLLTFVLLSYPLPFWLRRAGIVVGLVALVAIFSLVLLNVAGERAVRWFTKRLKFLPQNLLTRAEAVGGGFVAGTSGLRHASSALRFSGYTILIWAVELFIMLLIGQIFNLPVSLFGMLFVMLVVGLGTMVPSSPGYIGTYEFFAVNALGALGVTGTPALSFAFVSHAVTLLGSSIIGALCMASQRIELSSALKREAASRESLLSPGGEMQGDGAQGVNG